MSKRKVIREHELDRLFFRQPSTRSGRLLRERSSHPRLNKRHDLIASVRNERRHKAPRPLHLDVKKSDQHGSICL